MGTVTPLVGQVVEERYRIEAEIGCGAMGMVFRARHVRVGREVAIKVLHGHLMRDPVMVERFDREAAIVARLHHKNLVEVIDVGETADKQRYMVLDLVRGPSLAALITQARMERTRVIHLTREILSGLDHAHRAGLVHRDLKPENVIVERDNFGVEVPRIVDFGIATLRDAAPDKRLTAAGTILGTPAYMAPEQAQGGDADPRTDLFALGVMVYEMLTGRQPFDGTSMEIVLANITLDPPRMAERTSLEVDPLLEAFARKLMARRLRDRFASARDALDLLALVERDREAAATVLGIPSRTRLATARTQPMPALPRPRTMPMGTHPPIGPETELDPNPLARTIAMLRKRAEEERASTLTVFAPPATRRARRWPILAAIVLALGGAIGWSLARTSASHHEVLR